MGRFRRRPADLSPQPMYWDPRYQRYFFAGLLPPLPPEAVPGLQQQPAAPVPSVELVPMKRTRRPSILVTGSDRSTRREEQEERHISWSFLEDEDGDNPAEDQGGAPSAPTPSRLSSSTACLLVLVSLLVIAATFGGASGSIARGWRAAQNAGKDATATAAALTEATNALASVNQVRAELDTSAPSASADNEKPARKPRISSRTTTENDDSTDYTDDDDVTEETTTRRRASRTFHRKRRAPRARRGVRRASTKTTQID